jgi:thioredoxin-related protein
MKNVFKYIFVGLLFTNLLHAADFYDAVYKAKGTNKLILVELVQDFCPYCIRMDKSVLSRDDVKKILDEKYVFIKLNTKSDDIPDMMKSRITPSFYFLSNDGEKVLEEVIGLMSKSDFTFYLEEIYKQADK